MSLNAPSWWYSQDRLMPTLLFPLSYLYEHAVRYRQRRANPYVSKLPVICVGNYTVGGAGKTPTSLYIARLLQGMGERPVFLSRGYGGAIRGPHLVDIENDSSTDVGDEPLLLARCSPAVISGDRAAGAQFIEAMSDYNPSVIIMDDGFQNPGLIKSLSVIVVDGGVGIGNGKVFPAGPLREPLERQIKRTDILITITSEKYQDTLKGINPSIIGELIPDSGSTNWEGRRILAYSGIARPEKFYRTLRGLGASIEKTLDFPDHHSFSEKDMLALLEEAEQSGLELVTTEKDIVRLNGNNSLALKLRDMSSVLPVQLHIPHEDLQVLTNVIKKKIKYLELRA